MGLVYAKIKLVNSDDKALYRNGHILKEGIRHMDVTAMVDSGAVMMVINENIKTQLGLEVIEYQEAQLADGTLIELPIVGPLEVIFENRRSTCDAMVIQGDNEILLGAIPVEQMDVLIHPKENKLIVNPSHPYKAVVKLK